MYGVRVMVLNAPFNNISVISFRSVLLLKETGGPEENHRPDASHWQTLSHNVVSNYNVGSGSQEYLQCSMILMPFSLLCCVLSQFWKKREIFIKEIIYIRFLLHYKDDINK